MPLKPVFWIGSSYKDYCGFPDPVQDAMGFALYWAQLGRFHPDGKPLKGFGGAGVVELVNDHRGDAFRAVYTVRFAEVVYVLHAFQKKSRKGIKTDPKDIELVKQRLALAEADHRRWMAKAGENDT